MISPHKREEEKMKKLLTATFIGVLVLSFLVVPAVSAQAAGPKVIRCDQMIVFDFINSDHWVGSLTGCAIAGTVEYWETDQNYVVGAKGGKVEHYFEIFKITTASGVIWGHEKGVYNFMSNFKFNADGWVTSATGNWAYLVGYKFHEIGWTTDPNDPTATAIYGPSSMFLAP
jgi:hypothetical protein